MVAREKVIDRIRKLLAIANKASEHEAATAAAQAAKLMAAHGIESIADVEDPVGDNMDLHVRVGNKSRPPSWKWNLSWIVGETGRCKPYPVHHKVGNDVVGVSIAFIGRRSDAELCMQLFEYLLTKLEELHRLRRPQIGKRIQQYVPGASPPTVTRDYQRQWSRDFYRGMVAMLHGRMITTTDAVMETADSTALVFLGKVAQRVEHVANEMGIEYVDAPDVQVHSAHGFNAGIAAARNVDLSAPTPDKSDTRRKLPPKREE